MAGIVWWEVETAEPERFQRFHASLSGWDFERAFAETGLGADYWITRHGGEGISGLQRAASPVRPSTAGARVHLAVDDLEVDDLAVDDLEVALARVVELGGTVERARTELGEDDRWFGVFRDPTGVSFGLWTRNPQRGGAPAQDGASTEGPAWRSEEPAAPDAHADSDAVRYEWRGPFANREVDLLHAEAFDHPPFEDDWADQLGRLSLGWVTARDDQGLVGFVNVIWDGLVHAFVEDTAVAVRARRRGIGVRLIATAREHAAAAGCEWLHVDFEDHLRDFYLGACGFTPTSAGLIRLR
ncbi:GNAT family N-acetyltransferase [Clavibacter michiganensis subsp. insidiosus]|uniref:GNAT family N-acetyltransferase n=1 Tax=Clavibacter michiganensis subsp. insidiosus TaxID=33014 RepID=A0A399SLI1_9MICO|nr:GNAT family N-acetyltransferase [Clavibacter michiganensis]AWG02153.1 acetyltransferase [Clavibacter michiganensis subsp. insidiosus]RII87360.1 GNAT family N-acetyltransferase [Clavibacter michiganensis subsp. insidiosus]RIJ43729.1 GNAT family N-acetyltransferase [Clavibacter michiganensis subsp. insidiosus]RMC87844.1 GNAT family N-acetyltransferase [Clavibacter michiganensis subsp. insidiosus]